jgi:predicted transcriptional regulator
MVDFRDFESISLRELLQKDKNPPVRINTSYTELVECAVNQNFIPVIDDRDSFIGIVTRKAIITQLSVELKQYHYEELFREQPLMDSRFS